MIDQFTTPLSTKQNIEKFMFRQNKKKTKNKKKPTIFIKKYFYHDFFELNLKNHTKTVISN